MGGSNQNQKTKMNSAKKIITLAGEWKKSAEAPSGRTPDEVRAFLEGLWVAGIGPKVALNVLEALCAHDEKP
jgi:hypothetical protein